MHLEMALTDQPNFWTLILGAEWPKLQLQKSILTLKCMAQDGSNLVWHYWNAFTVITSAEDVTFAILFLLSVDI